ncbi:ribonuclease P/MRP protein subunit POP5 isoform X1 [Dendroctonus ponderosae]
MVRYKNRYIVLEVNSNTSSNSIDYTPLKLTDSALNHSLHVKMQQLHGDFGIAAIRAGLYVKYINELTKVAVIKCRHGPHTLITSVIPFITHIESHNVSCNILYVGATLRKCFSFIKLHQERKCDEFCAHIDSEEAKQLRAVLLNFEKLLNVVGN